MTDSAALSPVCDHGVVTERGLCGRCELAETEAALALVMDERNDALRRLDEGYREIERLHALTPRAHLYDDGAEARPGDPCIWCDHEKGVGSRG